MTALADALGVHRQQVWQWVKGTRPVPKEYEGQLEAHMGAIA